MIPSLTTNCISEWLKTEVCQGGSTTTSDPPPQSTTDRSIVHLYFCILYFCIFCEPRWTNTTTTGSDPPPQPIRGWICKGTYLSAKVHAPQFPPQFPPRTVLMSNEPISIDFWIWFPSICESYFHQFAFQIFDLLSTRMSWGRELWDRWVFASFAANNGFDELLKDFGHKKVIFAKNFGNIFVSL